MPDSPQYSGRWKWCNTSKPRRNSVQVIKCEFEPAKEGDMPMPPFGILWPIEDYCELPIKSFSPDTSLPI